MPFQIHCISGLRFASRAFADVSGDVPEGEQETARLPGERVRQGTTGVSAAFSCGSWSTVSSFHINERHSKTMGLLYSYIVDSISTRRRLARERKRCFSSSSEDGSRKR